jgi:sugar lactone lactonase YvrE
MKFFIMKSILSTAGVLCLSASLFAQHSVTKLWETDTLLKVPESVLFDADNNVLYVSNIDGTDGWAKDGKGSIAKVGLDGKIIAVEWVTGLNAPKGLGMYKGKLLAADIDEIVVIDIKKGAIEKKIPIEGAKGLNDISIGSNGAMYVSDSKNNVIYRVANEKPSVYVQNLKGANGVLKQEKDFYLVDAGGAYKVNDDKTITKISDGMEGGTDGIENINGNDFLVSCWQGALWYVHADGTKELLFDGKSQKTNTADIGFDPKTNIVYVPTFFRNSVIAFQVK